MSENTIAAIATPLGLGGIGIIRIAGPCAFEIARSIFNKKSHGNCKTKSNTDLKSHNLYLGEIYDKINNTTIDEEVLLVLMKAPNSYTREDVAEIQAHGGIHIMGKILDLVVRRGAKIAQPGEFTKRAYLNGRMDLSQAEGVIDLINARTDEALRMANFNLKGGMGKKIEAIREALINQISNIEANLDFQAEDEQDSQNIEVIESLEKLVVDKIQDLLQNYDKGHVYSEGIQITIIGTPNVGKSSLMNRLTKKERSIVTKIAGTTRDLVKESITINGQNIELYDTAGLQDSNDPVEKIGVERAWKSIEEADLVLFVLENGRDLSSVEKKILKRIDLEKTKIIINKIDLQKSMKAPEGYFINNNIDILKISALKNIGIKELLNEISDMCLNRYNLGKDSIVPNARQKNELSNCLKYCKSALDGMRQGIGDELTAIDLRKSIGSLDNIIGKNISEDLLTRIFNKFCIGK